jgi:hypothetical protein
VFSDFPCRETPKSTLKKKDVRRFPVLFFSAPLLPTMSQPKTKQKKNARLEVHANFLPPDQYYRRQQAAAHSLASPGDKWQVAGADACVLVAARGAQCFATALFR